MPFILGIFKAIPAWLWAVLGVFILCIAIYWKGGHDVRQQWYAERDEWRAKAEAQEKLNQEAIAKAQAENKLTLEKQKKTNDNITAQFKKDIQDLSTTNVDLRRVRLGTSFTSCNPTGEAIAQGTSGSITASETSRILQERSNKDPRELNDPRALKESLVVDLTKLINDIEHDVSVARACQQFVLENKLY